MLAGEGSFIVLKGVVGCCNAIMVLGKLPVPGRPTNLDNNRARANCACSTQSAVWVEAVWTSFSLSLGDSWIHTVD